MEVSGGNRGFEAEGGDLRECVDAGVGAAGALGKTVFAGDMGDAAGERALDGGEAGLDLPAVKCGAVVGESDLPVGRCGY